MKSLEQDGVNGVLHTYNAYQHSAFVAIPKILSETNIKHMIAVRPYTISPQLISQMSKTLNELYGKDVVQVNLVSGWIKENEASVGGIIGLVNDQSSAVDRSKYLAGYIDVLESLETKTLDYYVSVTNQFIFDKAAEYDSKIIIHYSHFEENKYDIKDKKVMVQIDSIDKNGKILTHEDLFEKLTTLGRQGIKEVMFSGGDNQVMQHILDFIKKYREKENK